MLIVCCLVIREKILSLEYTGMDFLANRLIVEDVIALYPYCDLSHILQVVQLLMATMKENMKGWNSCPSNTFRAAQIDEKRTAVISQWILECWKYPCSFLATTTGYYTFTQTWTKHGPTNKNTLPLGIIQLQSTHHNEAYLTVIHTIEKMITENACPSSALLERLILLFTLAYDPLDPRDNEYLEGFRKSVDQQPDPFASTSISAAAKEQCLSVQYQYTRNATGLKELVRHIYQPFTKTILGKGVNDERNTLYRFYWNDFITSVSISFSMKKFLELIASMQGYIKIAQPMIVTSLESTFQLWFHIQFHMIEYELHEMKAKIADIFQLITFATTSPYASLFPKDRMDRIIAYIGAKYQYRFDDELLNYSSSTTNWEHVFQLSEIIKVPKLLGFLTSDLNPLVDTFLNSVQSRTRLWTQLCLQHTNATIFKAMLKVFGDIAKYLSSHTMENRRKSLLTNTMPMFLKCFTPFLSNTEYKIRYEEEKMNVIRRLKSKKAVINILEPIFAVQ